VEFVVSDDHPGMRRAIAEVLPEAVWQRCYVHFLRNALDYPARRGDDDCLQELRWIYGRPTLDEDDPHEERRVAVPGHSREDGDRENGSCEDCPHRRVDELGWAQRRTLRIRQRPRPSISPIAEGGQPAVRS
jgi:hypothetical protein